MPQYQAIKEHLAWWGLREFLSHTEYDRWQRDSLTPDQIHTLNRLAQARRASLSEPDEVMFYDCSAEDGILPVLYSQRYHYYLTIGDAVITRLPDHGSILDFGCGPGILTTLYARHLPDCSFLGLDRSPACLQAARQRAAQLELKNVQFTCLNLGHSSLPGHYDLVVTSHALLQSEGDPGLPSKSWRNIERAQDATAQSSFEERTGLSRKLATLAACLKPGGRMIVLEKVHHVGRRVPFQRALASRGFRLLEPPSPIRYSDLEDRVDDGPLYVVMRVQPGYAPQIGLDWDESPHYDPVDEVYSCSGRSAQYVWQRLPGKNIITRCDGIVQRLGTVQAEWGNAAECLRYLFISEGDHLLRLWVGGPKSHSLIESWFESITTQNDGAAPRDRVFMDEAMPLQDSQFSAPETPVYENHCLAAQEVWASLPKHHILKEVTDEGTDGRQLHIELGRSAEIVYLYCANTFDQRQLVIMDQARGGLLEAYYDELLEGQTSHRPGGARS